MKKLFILLVFIFSCLLQAQTASGESEEKKKAREELKRILDSSPDQQLGDAWKNGILGFFNKCNGGECLCVLGITKAIDQGTGKFWFGGFENGQVKNMYSSYGRIKRGAVTYSGKLKPCHAARQLLIRKKLKDPSEGKKAQCCMRSNVKGEVCTTCETYDTIAKELGLEKGSATKHLYYGSTLSGPTGAIYLHDNTLCKGPTCRETLGCPTIDKFAMQDLCRNHIGQDVSKSMDQNPVAYNPSIHKGVYYYFGGQVSTSEDGAIEGLMKHKEKCQGANYAQLKKDKNSPQGIPSVSKEHNSVENSGQQNTYGSSQNYQQQAGGGGGAGAALGGAGSSVLKGIIAIKQNKDAEEARKKAEANANVEGFAPPPPQTSRTYNIGSATTPKKNCVWANGRPGDGC